MATATTIRGSRARAARSATATSVRAHSATPTIPSGHGSAAPGRPAANRATAAIMAEGSQASHTTTCPSAGAQVNTRQATQPSTVATGAAGSATRLARTPNSGSVGVSRISTGWQASCAASGTASANATPRGSHRARMRASGRASTRRPAVASTESAKP